MRRVHGSFDESAWHDQISLFCESFRSDGLEKYRPKLLYLTPQPPVTHIVRVVVVWTNPEADAPSSVPGAQKGTAHNLVSNTARTLFDMLGDT